MTAASRTGWTPRCGRVSPLRAPEGRELQHRDWAAVSVRRLDRDVSCYAHAVDFVMAAWPTAAAKSRISWLETLSVAMPVLTRDIVGRPDPDVLRLALRRALNQNKHGRAPTLTSCERWPGLNERPCRSAPWPRLPLPAICSSTLPY